MTSPKSAQERAEEYAHKLTKDRAVFDGNDERVALVAFKAGHSAGVADARELRQELANISGWLKRMSALNWDDETYAPNFKSAHERAESALSRFKALAGVES